MKRAFTLIELLVVIAIIAILAAILFPVFAQAKEAAKKTTALSNAKQQGTAYNIYLGDFDDTYPLSMSARADGSWRITNVFPVPNTAITSGGWNTPAGLDASGVVYANSLQPYMKSTGLFELSGKRNVTFGGTWGTGKPAPIGLHFNGLLHAYNASGVASPSVAVIAWPAYGDNNITGWTAPNPVLNCGGRTDCRYNASGPPQTPYVDGLGTGLGDAFYGGWDSTSSMFVYGQTMPIVRTDSSAKSVRSAAVIAADANNPPVTPGDNAWVAPNDAVDKQGHGLTYWACGAGNDPLSTATDGSQYTCFFRPDREK